MRVVAIWARLLEAYGLDGSGWKASASGTSSWWMAMILDESLKYPVTERSKLKVSATEEAKKGEIESK